MKAISLAYLAGVLNGDAWCTDTFGLKVADRDFADAFALALRDAFAVRATVNMNSGYWQVRVRNPNHRYDFLRGLHAETPQEKAAWLRGLFDSEGNAQLTKAKISENSWHRRVAMYSTNERTLFRAAAYCSDLGIATIRYDTNPSEGHKGDKPVYELRITVNRENFARFATLVGSSIARKRQALDAIPASYRPDGEYLREGQARGAAVRRERTMQEVLPVVLAAMRERDYPTQRECQRDIAGYSAVRHVYIHSELVRMAKEAS